MAPSKPIKGLSPTEQIRIVMSKNIRSWLQEGGIKRAETVIFLQTWNNDHSEAGFLLSSQKIFIAFSESACVCVTEFKY